MKINPELRAFLKPWRTALRFYISGRRTWDEQSQQWERYWEGFRAYEELRKLNYLQRVQLKRDLITEHAVEEVGAELTRYKQHMLHVKDASNHIKRLCDWLRDQSQVFREKAKHIRVHSPKLADQLLRYANRFEGECRILKWREREQWAYPLSVGGVLFETAKFRNPPRQERELDTQFCISLAMVFRAYLRGEDGLSLRTIARLIVLFLFCAQIGTIDRTPGNEGVVLQHNPNRKLTVRNVLQILTRAKVDPYGEDCSLLRVDEITQKRSRSNQRTQ